MLRASQEVGCYKATWSGLGHTKNVYKSEQKSTTTGLTVLALHQMTLFLDDTVSPRYHLQIHHRYEWMNECLTTPQHEKQIGYWVSEKGKCMIWLYNYKSKNIIKHSVKSCAITKIYTTGKSCQLLFVNTNICNHVLFVSIFRDWN